MAEEPRDRQPPVPPPNGGTRSALPTTRRKREAEEWALVLTAEGLDVRVVHEPAGFGIAVAVDEHERAAAILRAWREERAEVARERARASALPVARMATRFETAVAYACALALPAFHLGLERSGRAAALVEAGGSRAALVLDGQLWRLVTALTLHADLPHVLGNTLFGGFFLAALASRLGIGLALLAFVVTGTLGNLANALYYGSAHGSIGASTGVFGLVGVLAGLAAWRRHHAAPARRGAWLAFAAGIALVAMLGTGGPEVDLSAHLFGLGAGALAGVLLAIPFAARPAPGRAVQAGAAVLAVAKIFAAWMRALA